MSLSNMRKLLAVICLSSMVVTNVNAIPITDTVIGLGDGNEWAQVTSFTNLSWNDMNAVCPAGVCGVGQLNGFDMDGWTWASNPDVGDLFALLTPFPGGSANYVEAGSAWAPLFLSLFAPTSPSDPDGLPFPRDTIQIITQSLDDELRFIPAIVWDATNPDDNDAVSTRGFGSTDLAGDNGGWFYREAQQSVPEPGTLGLLGAGLLGLAFRRKKAA